MEDLVTSIQFLFILIQRYPVKTSILIGCFIAALINVEVIFPLAGHVRIYGKAARVVLGK